MIGTLARALAYSKAPKTTLAISHPRKAVKLAKLRWDLKHAPAPRLTAAAAAVLALPLGFAIGRLTHSHSGERQHS